MKKKRKKKKINMCALEYRITYVSNAFGFNLMDYVLHVDASGWTELSYLRDCYSFIHFVRKNEP